MTQTKNQRRRKRQKRKKKNNQKVVETKAGLVIENMDSDQKKVLNNLLFAATDPSKNTPLPGSVLGAQGRALPNNDIKKDHLLIKGINLSKDPQTGTWEISSIDTNHGQFGTGEKQTERINQTLVRNFVAYIKNIFENDIREFINSGK